MTADPAAAAPMDEPEPPLAALLEAILLVVDEPVPGTALAQVVERPLPEVTRALTDMSLRYTAEGRGFDLRSVAGGWRFYTRAECAPWVERFVQEGQAAKLSQAALETLAIVAYQQPVTRGRIAGEIGRASCRERV